MVSTIHRFTPPTCTLEIQGKKSPLSHWTNQDLLKNFRFQLKFDDPRVPTSNQVTIKGDRQDIEQLQTAVDFYIQNFLHSSFKLETELIIDSTANNKFPKNQPYLQSHGLSKHELFLGKLTHDSNANKIQLSTVQLFDLVTALEAYKTQIAALPELKPARAKKVIPLWSSVAAVTIAAVGITTVVLRSPSPENVASSSKPEPPEDTPQLNDVVPPQLPKTARKPVPQPKLNESLSSTTRLPPPPAVDTPKPKPDIPDPADYSLSEIARQSGLNNPAEKKNPANQQIESVIKVPAETKPDQKEISQDTVIEKEFSPSRIAERDGADTTPQLKTEINPNLAQELPQPSNSTVITTEESALSQQTSDLALGNSRSQPNQLQEIKTYFEEKWQPPAELKQSLEYRLLLNPDGSINRVVPLGQAAKLYLSKTNIPVQGEPFISPASVSQKYQVRLLLSPDGKVQAFKE
ncbi:DUF4335 domain-containing protein [Pleurocapsa sp. PCC 7319]|uniref:DUF4335 domain-containing protein n=1 Tax=Pleurocapsa sp. PCC 7319 TaxID=118161 RepID=UPI00034C07C9|nr:DUF4335 domain-containing protein [Pleurocapsa sp. PCC 7319]